jgi:hypothetical protein
MREIRECVKTQQEFGDEIKKSIEVENINDPVKIMEITKNFIQNADEETLKMINLKSIK